MTRIEKAVVFALMFVLCGASIAQQKKDPPKETAPATQTKPTTPAAEPQVQMPSPDFQNGMSQLDTIYKLISKHQATVESLQEDYNTLAAKLKQAIPPGYSYQNGVFVKIKQDQKEQPKK